MSSTPNNLVARREGEVVDVGWGKKPRGRVKESCCHSMQKIVPDRKKEDEKKTWFLRNSGLLPGRPGPSREKKIGLTKDC